MSNPSDIFVSYKSEDRRRVEPLVNALRSQGFSVWWDAQIGAGSDWRGEIEDHLNSARCAIVVWSKNSVGSGGKFVRDEANRAQELGTYLPVRIDNIKPPLGFGEIQALSLEGWRGKTSDPRFAAVQEAARAIVEGREAPAHMAPVHGPTISRRAAMVGGGVAAVALAGGAGFWLLGGNAAAKRIAVMPFENLSGDSEQSYLAEGIAEEVRSSLTRIGMEVIGRNSSDAMKKESIKAIASELGVSNLVTGSVRKSTDKLRINAQLVETESGTEKWSQAYDRKPGDIIAIQVDIAQQVASALSVALGAAAKAAMTLGGTKDPIALELYNRAREVYRKDTSDESTKKALALYEAAVERDPQYIDAWVLKCTFEIMLMNGATTKALSLDYRSNAVKSARRAMELGPEYGPSHLANAMVQENFLELQAAARSARRALQLAPNDNFVVGISANMLGKLVNPQRYVDVSRRALDLDPLNPNRVAGLALQLYLARRYEESTYWIKREAKLRPGPEGTNVFIAMNYMQLGNDREAWSWLKKVDPATPVARNFVAVFHAHRGEVAKARPLIDGLAKEFADRWYGPMAAYAPAQMGDLDEAFRLLHLGLEQREPLMAELKFEPLLDPIRKDPRYHALIKRLNFPS